MIPRPPSATRTYPLCPYPTLFRSLVDFDAVGLLRALERDLRVANLVGDIALARSLDRAAQRAVDADLQVADAKGVVETRSEEHTSELQSLMRISYAVFCLKKKKHIINLKCKS